MKITKHVVKSRQEVNKNPKVFYFLVLITTVLCMSYFSLEKQWTSDSLDVVNRNYFLDTDQLSKIGLIVNTSTCQVPDFDPWDNAMVPFITKAEPLVDCKKNSYNWSYIEGDELIIRTENMKQDGYSFRNGSCCYKVIRRIEQSLDQYDENADNLISYSSCIPISQVKTKILQEFLMVECSRSKFIGVAYRAFHFIPQKHNGEKFQFWKEKSILKPDPPPNILVIGIDSTSRLNFRRNMFKTREVLESLGSVEMLGYAKVGENTFPNFCPILTGYSGEEFQRICFFNSSTKVDECPFIWKRFNAGNYITAYVEDAPAFTAFNFRKTGFVKQPVDFYTRPLFLAAHDYGSAFHLSRSEHMDCIGYETNDEILSTYLESTLDFSRKENTPIFALSWSTTLAHDNPNMIQLCDDTYANLLKKLDKKGHLDNTILIFMGDHGYRYGPWRQTLIGYYEDRLPNMWIRLPPTVRNKFPEWQINLENNKRLRTSPYTLYWTLQKLLDAFTHSKKQPDSVDHTTKKVIRRKHKLSFLHPIPPENTCEDVGTPEKYCPCYPLQKVELDDSTLYLAARAATQKINSDLINSNSKCSQLKVSKVSAGAVMNKTSVSHSKLSYIVGFVTEPGGFVFEAEINFYPGENIFSKNPSVQRASKINHEEVKCVTDVKLELFCFCSS